LFLAAPVKWKGKLVQYAGRIMGPYPGKETAEVHDYHDAATGVLAATLTQAELADALGVSQARVSKIEHGEISGIDVVRAYVAALGGSVDVVARLGDRSWKVA